MLSLTRGSLSLPLSLLLWPACLVSCRSIVGDGNSYVPFPPSSLSVRVVFGQVVCRRGSAGCVWSLADREGHVDSRKVSDQCVVDRRARMSFGVAVVVSACGSVVRDCRMSVEGEPRRR